MEVGTLILNFFDPELPLEILEKKPELTWTTITASRLRAISHSILVSYLIYDNNISDESEPSDVGLSWVRLAKTLID